MRIALTADVHFGHSDHLGRVNPETGLHTRLEDFLRNFDIIIDYVLDSTNKIEMLIIAGDLYKTRHPTNTQQEEFAKRLKRLQDYKVQTLILMGNHDIVVSEGSSHTAGVLKALVDDSYIHVFDKPSVWRALNDCTQIALMPFIYRQKLGVKTNEEALLYYKDSITELLKRMKNCRNKIFVGHQSVEGAKMPSGMMEPEKMSEIVVPLSYLEGFDFAVFGHIHEYQIIGKNPVAIYTGPLDRIDFSNANKPIGFVVYDTETNTHEFIDLPAVDLYRIRVDLSDGRGDLTERVLQVIDMSRVPNSIMKIECKIRETDLALLNKSALQEVLDKARFDAGIVTDIQRVHTSRNQEVNESVSSYEALKKYIEDREDLKDIADDMMKRGSEIIKLCDLNRR